MPLNTFFVVAYMNRTVAPCLPEDGRGIFHLPKIYTGGFTPAKTLIKQQSLPVMPVLSLASGTAVCGEKEEKKVALLLQCRGHFP